MQHIIHLQKDLMLEAASYLSLLAGDTSLEATLSKLEVMYGQTEGVADFKAKAEIIQKLAEQIANRYTPDPKELERFFRPFSIGQGSLMQVLIYSFYDPSLPDWAAQTANIQKKFAEFASSPSPSLQQLSLGRIFDDSFPEGKEEQPLVEQLEDTGLTGAEKWQILRLIQNTPSYLEQLTNMLMPVKALIEENFPLVQPLLEDFANRWQAYFEKVSFKDFLSENLGIEPGDVSGFTMHIYPSIFECGTIQLHIEQDTKDIYMQIGLCVPEGINVKALPMESHLLLEGLKALSDKSKLAILSHIRNKRSYGQELARETGLSTATISHHMSALINCGFILMERAENRIYYQMDKENVKRFLQKLSLYLLSGEGTGMPLS